MRLEITDSEIADICDAKYSGLGRTAASRLEADMTLFEIDVDEHELKKSRDALQTRTPLGNEHFREKIVHKLKSKVGQARRGCPVWG